MTQSDQVLHLENDKDQVTGFVESRKKLASKANKSVNGS